MLSWLGLTLSLLAAANGGALPPGDAADIAARFADVVKRDDAAALAALAAPGGITAPEWAHSPRWLLDNYDRFELDRCEVVAQESGADGRRFLVLELLGTASPSGRPDRRKPLLRWWSLEVVPTPASWRIASAMTREDRLASTLVAAAPAEREAAFTLPFVDSSALLRAFAYAGEGEAGIALDRWVLDVARRRGDRRREATAMRSIASNETSIGRQDDALRDAREALELARRAEAPAEIGACWFTIGIAQWYRNDIPAAVDALLAAAAAVRDEDEPREGLQYVYMAAHLQAANGRLREALQTAGELQRRLSRSPLPRSVVDLDLLLGELYGQLGDRELALHAYQRAYEGSRALGLDDLATTALAGLANGEDDPAVLRHLLAEAKPEPGRIDLNVAFLHLRLGGVLRLRGDRDGAEAELQEALRIARVPDERRAAAAALDELAELRLDEGRPAEALAFAAEATKLQEGPEGDLRVVGVSAPWPPRTLQARALIALGRREEAERNLAVAVEQVEQRESSLPEDAFSRAAFFDDKGAPYRELAALQAAAGDPAAALATAERMRARALREQLLRGRVDLSTSLGAEERAEEARLDAEVVDLNRKLLAADDDASRQRLTAERESARLAWQRYVSMLYAAHPRLRQRRAGIDELPGGHATIPLRGLALEYVVGRDRTLLFVSGHRPGGEPFVEALPIAISAADLERRVGALTAAVAGDDPSFAAPARSLYDVLLAPAERYFAGVDQVCIVPDGVLWNVPFRALLAADGRPLAARLASFVAPSLRMVAASAAAKSGSTSRLLAVGNPTMPGPAARARASERGIELGPLPEAETEARTIARLYGPDRSDLWVAAQATETRFKSAARGYQVLHLATHGLLDDVNPMFSSLVLAEPVGDLAEDGLLEAREVAEMQLDAKLVVLSACDTGRGHVGNGEGVVGLAWAFLAAGVPTLVVSDWKTDSRATARLMVRFHHELLAGHAPVEALRRAELALAADPLYSHPYYWAAFAVVGEGW